MNIRFSAGDVQAWADFSGDTNPIHFDRASARLAGLDDVVVHGMLALLPVKQFLSDGHRSSTREHRSARLKAFFRSPVPYDHPQLVTVRSRGPGRSEFSVRCMQTRAERLRGSLADATVDAEAPPANAPRRCVDDIRPLLASFAASFPACHELWIGLDAVAFSEFVRRDMRTVASRVLDELAPENRANGVLGASVMQTSQDLFISKAVIDMPLSRILTGKAQSLNYAFETGLVIANRAEVSGTVRTAVWVDGVHAIQAEYGLLLRSHIPSNQVAIEGVSHVGL